MTGVTSQARRPGDEPSIAVAIDVGPLLGPLTGVGAAVQQIVSSLAVQPGVTLQPYACSFRGSLEPGTTRLALPMRI